MNSNCLPGCDHWYARNTRTPAAFVHESPGIRLHSVPLPCTTSSCESGSTKFSLHAYISENVISW
ncbi:Uncharacterised protein [Mycobacteroides abscessus subsp. abscessus]|nr:Uncharacterised protein [Mycobacteroides abscessus subsp. abscessus]